MAGWIGWALAGALMIVGGVFALLDPFGASLAAVILAGWAFLFGGAFQIAGMFRAEGWKSRIWAIVTAAALLWLGISLLMHPLAGMMTLSFAVAVGFIVAGLAKTMMAFSLAEGRPFWMLALSGAVSVLLGIYILATFATSAVTILGILLGIDLISTGVSFVLLALTLRKAQAAEG